jgi:hypothetical protein
MTDTTPRAGAPLLAAAQAQKHVTHNEALYQLDALLCARFLDRDLSAPPSSPADGDTYLVKSTGTGAWAGQDGKIAYCADGGGWRFYAPFAGLVAYVADETALIVFDGTAWTDYGSLISVQNIPHLGVNTTADSTNKLSVQADAALFSAMPTTDGGSGDMRVVLNKQTSANTATLLFQDSFSGRAEIGLAGDDDVHFKVSADGATWTEALKLSAATGLATLPAGQLRFPATPNPSADANTLDDYEEGTFTPTLAGSTTAGSHIYSHQTGFYTKVGRLVTFSAYVALSAKDAAMAGSLSINGLPFTMANDVSAYYPCAAYWSNVNLGTATPTMMPYVAFNHAQVMLVAGGNNTTAVSMTPSMIGNTSQIIVSGSYHV